MASHTILQERVINKTGSKATSISITFKGYSNSGAVYKKQEIDHGDGFKELVRGRDLTKENISFTDTYSWDIPTAKQWVIADPLTEANGDLRQEALNLLKEDSDYINKIDVLKTKLEEL
tara:strand:+ start:912 stop:1268 length:357 start_codon:yes stop_codon:yes gene_type:complete